MSGRKLEHDLDEANETVMKNGNDLENDDAKVKKITHKKKGLQIMIKRN